MQPLRPHEIAAARLREPPRPVGRRRFRDQGGWLRAAIVLVVTFFVVWLTGSAILNELDGGKGGGDPWFNVPPFHEPDYTIPPPPDWVNSRPPVQPPPSRRGYGDGWRECRPGRDGRWDCAAPPPDQGRWPW